MMTMIMMMIMMIMTMITYCHQYFFLNLLEDCWNIELLASNVDALLSKSLSLLSLSSTLSMLFLMTPTTSWT